MGVKNYFIAIWYFIGIGMVIWVINLFVGRFVIGFLRDCLETIVDVFRYVFKGKVE